MCLKFVRYCQITLYRCGTNLHTNWKCKRILQTRLLKVYIKISFGFPNLIWNSEKRSEGDDEIIQTEDSVWCSHAQPFPADAGSLQKVSSLTWHSIWHGNSSLRRAGKGSRVRDLRETLKGPPHTSKALGAVEEKRTGFGTRKLQGRLLVISSDSQVFYKWQVTRKRPDETWQIVM